MRCSANSKARWKRMTSTTPRVTRGKRSRVGRRHWGTGRVGAARNASRAGAIVLGTFLLILVAALVLPNAYATFANWQSLAEDGGTIKGRLLAYRVASMQARGEVPNAEASISKVFGSELQQRLANTAVAIRQISACYMVYISFFLCHKFLRFYGHFLTTASIVRSLT